MKRHRSTILAYLHERRWLCLLIPPLLAFIVHSPILSGELFWDDGATYEFAHPRIADPDFFKEVLWAGFHGLEYRGEAAGYYRPLLMFSKDVGLFLIFCP